MDQASHSRWWKQYFTDLLVSQLIILYNDFLKLFSAFIEIGMLFFAIFQQICPMFYNQVFYNSQWHAAKVYDNQCLILITGLIITISKAIKVSHILGFLINATRVWVCYVLLRFISSCYHHSECSFVK